MVTGASAGLGARFARVLHAAGATVVTAARRLDALEALAAELGERVVPIRCDVGVDADCEALVQRTLEVANGRIDVLVNNAALSPGGPGETEARESFRSIMAVNVTGLFVLTQLVGREMLEAGRGSIVNLASIMGVVASAPLSQSSYTASKGAVVNLTRELGCQWGRRGVRVNALAPGWFPTDGTAEVFGDERARAYVERNCPMGRGGREEELDGALLFLASDASTYVTGSVLTVDGGWTAR